MRPPELGGHPHDGCCHDERRTESRDEPPEQEGKKRGKEREISDQRRVDQDGHPHLQAAVDGHHVRDPVQSAGKIERPGREPEAECISQGATLESHEQRRQRDPGDSRMTKTWKAEGEQEPGAGGQRVTGATRNAQRVTQGLNCSSFWSLAAMTSASRRVGNGPTRTRNTF